MMLILPTAGEDEFSWKLNRNQYSNNGLGNEDELIHWVCGYNNSVLMIERMLTNGAERQGFELKAYIHAQNIDQQREVNRVSN